MTPPRDMELLPMFVIDVLRHGQGGKLESVLNRLNNRDCIGWRDQWPHDFAADEVVPILKDLAQRGIITVAVVEIGKDDWTTVEPCDELFGTRLKDLWFFMTEKAYEIWKGWEPPPQA